MSEGKVFEMTGMEFADWLNNHRLFLMYLHGYLNDDMKKVGKINHYI